MKRPIVFISEHASPLATLGGVDSGGQNVYIGELARNLVELGYHIDVFTRWDNADLPQVVCWIPGIRVIHIKAGPVETIEKEKLLPFMDEFTDNMISFITNTGDSYALIHANFWMSARVASDLKKILRIPYVVTFHALGYVRKMHQGEDDKFPSERIDIERRIEDGQHSLKVYTRKQFGISKFKNSRCGCCNRTNFVKLQRGLWSRFQFR